MRAWLIGLIGLLSPLLCAGLWSWGTYRLAEKEYTGPFQRPSERDIEVPCIHANPVLDMLT